MQVATLEESQHVAREKYAEYMKAVKERHSEEYEALKNGYRELSKGRQVIDIVTTMKNAGTDHLNRPKLAIVCADAKLCWYRWGRLRGQSDWTDRPTFSMTNDWKSIKSKSVVFPPSTFDGQPRGTLRAVVPTIPPSLLPGGKLSKYHILWEAEWETIPIDPMLLKHLGKSLYVVLAAWDLTPPERVGSCASSAYAPTWSSAFGIGRACRLSHFGTKCRVIIRR